MTGPEHYKAAEKYLQSADVAIGQYEENGWDGKKHIADTLTAQAQVHALLALCVEQGAGPPRPTINLILKGDITEETLGRLRVALKEATGNATVGITDGGAA
jgi:hypothetical protein